MIPRTFPSVISETDGSTQMVVSLLPSKVGLIEWIDYIPVKAVSNPDATLLNTYSASGYQSFNVLSDTTGKQAWVDYIPVFVEEGKTIPWSTDALGFIPYVSAGAAAWTPAALGADLALWLDADDASTITLNGSTVSQWDDKSGNGRHATQPTAANQPAYTVAGLNGKPIITFPGGGDGFVLASGVPIPRDMTSVSQGFGYLYSANTTTERVGYLSPGTSLFWNSATGAPAFLPIPGRDGTSTFIEQHTAQNNDWEVLLNGAVAASGTVSTSWANNNLMTQIGLQWASATGVPSWTGIIAEIVWTSAVMSLADRQKLEGYLAWKWSLEANLPADHPYKNAPPTV